jgi:hypothetical protein
MIADSYGLTLGREFASSHFAELMELLYHKMDEKTVVLVDEYDSPILDAMNKTAEEI